MLSVTDNDKRLLRDEEGRHGLTGELIVARAEGWRDEGCEFASPQFHQRNGGWKMERLKYRQILIGTGRLGR